MLKGEGACVVLGVCAMCGQVVCTSLGTLGKGSTSRRKDTAFAPAVHHHTKVYKSGRVRAAQRSAATNDKERESSRTVHHTQGGDSAGGQQHDMIGYCAYDKKLQVPGTFSAFVNIREEN
eukprot:5856300-Pyramimonas_sp.AAC.1